MDPIHELLRTGHVQDAANALTTYVAANEARRGGHDAEARLAEVLGLRTVALRAWSLVVRDQPDRAEAWSALAALYDEDGDRGRADECRRRAVEVARIGAPTPTNDAELVRLADRFAGRENVWARMWHHPERGTGYSPVHQPLSVEVWRAHLAGTATAGVYVVRGDGTVGFVVLDLDVTKDAIARVQGDADATRAMRAAIAAEGLRMRTHAREFGLDPILEDSGYKGRHLWCFLPAPLAAADARRAGEALAAALRPANPDLRLEVFPKQDSVAEGGLGNLVKLPLGVHRKTDRRCPVLDEAGRPAPDGIARILAAVPATLDRVPAPIIARAEVIAPAWVDSEFTASAELAPVLRGCAVLRAIVNTALAEHTLTREEGLVVEHSLGHLPDGVRATNRLFDLAAWPAETRMGAVHRGCAVSCAKVRRHLPKLTRAVPCACTFPDEPGRYPSPLRHAAPAEPKAPADISIPEVPAPIEEA